VRLNAVVANLLALDASRPRLALNSCLALDALRALPLDAGLTLDASRPRLPLDSSLALDMLRTLALGRSEALLALHPLRALHVERLAWRGAPFSGLGALRRGPRPLDLLPLDLVGIAVVAARASCGRRGNGQRRDSGSEE
jgi:hypothetical protein